MEAGGLSLTITRLSTCILGYEELHCIIIIQFGIDGDLEIYWGMPHHSIDSFTEHKSKQKNHWQSSKKNFVIVLCLWN